MVETVCWKPGVSEKNSSRKLDEQAGPCGTNAYLKLSENNPSRQFVNSA